MSRNSQPEMEELIIGLLRRFDGQYVSVKQLGHEINLSGPADHKKFRKALNRLSQKKRIHKTKDGKVALNAARKEEGREEGEKTGKDAGRSQDAGKKPAKPAVKSAGKAAGKGQSSKGNSFEDYADDHVVEGTFTTNRHGVGFVRVSGRDSDIRIPRKKLGMALEHDTVRVQLVDSGKSRQEGKVLDIVSRSDHDMVGTLRKQNDKAFYIEPDQKSAHVNFFVKPEHTENARHGDKVIFRLEEWTHKRALPEACVIEVLGPSGSNDAAMRSILAENRMKGPFKPEVEKEAEKIPGQIPKKEYERRRDIRDVTVFTIDPEDAQDFDDGLSIKKLNSGNFLLGVHIADVSYYVTPDSMLDQEAVDRGTSVYLVDRVIPMLPEKLSNGVCSLRPNEDKLAFSCFMEITPQGERIDYQFEETVIESKKRFTYEEAQAVIDGKKGKEGPFRKELSQLIELTQTLTKKRFSEGAVDLDTPEPEFVLDEQMHPVGVEIKERLPVHRLVEECMLMANRSVAWHIEQLRRDSGKKRSKDLYPFIYRVHDRPDPDKIQNIAENVRPLGIEFDTGNKGKISSHALNHLLERVRNTDLKYTINQLVLRSMAKAVYSPKNIGHFGLGFDHYTHYTSPIRRYPDLIVHRLLKSYLAGGKGPGYSELEKLGEHCSQQEQAAVVAERESIRLKQVEFLTDRIGEEFNGVISGVTEKGLFVILNDIFCEGMVAIRDLDDDYYVYDQTRHCLYGRKRGKEYQLGKQLRVQVAQTDLEQRTVDFRPLE